MHFVVFLLLMLLKFYAIFQLLKRSSLPLYQYLRVLCDIVYMAVSRLHLNFLYTFRRGLQWRPMLAPLSFVMSSPVSTWMGDRLAAVNLCPFVGVDLNL